MPECLAQLPDNPCPEEDREELQEDKLQQQFVASVAEPLTGHAQGWFGEGHALAGLTEQLAPYPCGDAIQRPRRRHPQIEILERGQADLLSIGGCNGFFLHLAYTVSFIG